MLRWRVIRRVINKDMRVAMKDWDGKDLILVANWDNFIDV